MYCIRKERKVFESFQREANTTKDKKMKDDLTAKEKEKISNYDELGHDDASKAGRDGPSMKMRPNDNKQGDKKIVNPVDDITKKAGYKTETFIDKISALYKSMLK